MAKAKAPSELPLRPNRIKRTKNAPTKPGVPRKKKYRGQGKP